MNSDMAMLIALHTASEKLLAAFNAAKAAKRDEIAAWISESQQQINRALRQLALDAGQLREVVS